MTIELGSGLSHFNHINMQLARIDIHQDMEEFPSIITALKDNNYKEHHRNRNDQEDKVYVLISANRSDRIKQSVEYIMKDQNSKIWIVPQVNSGIGSMYYERLQ